MNKKHFEALANMLRESKPKNRSAATALLEFEMKQWLLDVEMVARVCEQFNPNFNKDKFKQACYKGD